MKPAIKEAAEQLGDKVVGLVVLHRERTMQLTGRPGFWSAVTVAIPEDESIDVEGTGVTPIEAMEEAATEADLVEGEDQEEGE